MKKTAVLLTLILALCLSLTIPVFADNNNDWDEMPVITDIYELEKEKVYIEWDGNAKIYEVYVDQSKVDTVKIPSAIVKVKPGVHQIVIVPISFTSKDVSTKVEFEIANIAGASIDLGALGIDPKDQLRGNSSETFKLNYSVSPFLNSVPEVIGAYTDFDDNVLLTFTDKFDSDVYVVAVKNGKDVTNVEFKTTDKDAAKLIIKNNSTVTITLDKSYLKKQSCMIPELDKKYSFSVNLQKWPKNYVDGKKETDSVLVSKDSKYFDYTPYAAWKNAPEITYISQTADGQVTIRWDHEDNKLGCEYKVLKLDKVIGIKKGTSEIGKTKEHEFVVEDLMNGKHSFAVVPCFSKEEGISSETVVAEVANNWVSAPALEYEIHKDNQIELKWKAAKGVESYHITVYAGSGSLLRFVNLDFKKYEEFDVEVTSDDMTYSYKLGNDLSSESGVKLRFEIYAVRHAANGKEQQSAVSKQTVVIK